MTATLAERTITRAKLTLPYSGIWHADVWLDEPAELSGSVELVFDGLSLAGTVKSGAAYAGAADYRVVGGAGGWAKELPAKGYQSDAGVKLSMVLGDAAAGAGESVALAAGLDRDIGPAYVRPKASAIRTLSVLARSPFWIDAAGVTQIGPRPSGQIGTAFELTSYEPHERVAVVASETPEVFVPGFTVELNGAPSLMIGTVVHHLDGGSLRTELWGISATEGERLTAAIANIVGEATAKQRYQGVYEFRVVAQSGDRVDLQPARPEIGLPPIQRVRMRLGIPGARSTVALGASVLVVFVDGELSRPEVIAWPAADDSAADPSSVQLADQTDSVTVGTESGRVLRFGDVIMMPVGSAGIPTATVILGAKIGDVTTPVGPIVASRVKA